MCFKGIEFFIVKKPKHCEGFALPPLLQNDKKCGNDIL
jgi:hypothetical protein